MGVCGFFLSPFSAHAGFVSNLLSFLAPAEKEEAAVSYSALASFPLLGPRTPPSAVGGPDDTDELPPLSATQDSALVASRNPLGTVPSQSAISDQIVVYTVQEGDVPSAIAENFGISLNTLLWANNIRNPDLIRIGQELIILPITGIQYTVKSGDTISTIADTFKGDIEDILSFNGLAIDAPLQIGTTLIIPHGELAPVRAPSKSAVTTRVANLPIYAGYYLRPIAGGRTSQGLHGFNAVDLANSCGLPVVASADGRVIVARSSGWNGGYGNFIAIAHPNGTQTLYAHLSNVLVVSGQRVTQGQTIGHIGSTGRSTGCHVHFEVRGAQNPF